MFAFPRIVLVGATSLVRPVPSASRPGDGLHCASAETGRVDPVRRRADHQKKNLCAAKLVGTLPPLFVFLLHERNLRSFSAPRPMHLSVARASRCRSALPTEGACRPECYVGHNLALCYQPCPKKDTFRSRLRPVSARLVFIPSFTILCRQTHSRRQVMFGTQFDPARRAITFLAAP